jgi:hypothetical protein
MVREKMRDKKKKETEGDNRKKGKLLHLPLGLKRIQVPKLLDFLRIL